MYSKPQKRSRINKSRVAGFARIRPTRERRTFANSAAAIHKKVSVTGKNHHDIITPAAFLSLLTGRALFMDQLQQQVARARRRLIIEQFAGRLVRCLMW